LNNRILIAYASRAGSTAAIAQAIGTTLAASGAQYAK
jgi:menaquinone-dependent protoporphyrinogen IX oxidase